MFAGARQNDGKGGAAIELGLVTEFTAVLLDNSRRDGKAQSRSAFLGGEEGIKQALLHLSRNPFSGVGNFQNRGIGFVVDAQRDYSFVPDAVRRVLNQVDQHLFDLLGVRAHPGSFGRLQLQLDRGLFQLRLQQVMNFLQDPLRRDGNQFRLGRAGKLEEILDDPLQAADFIGNYEGVFVVRPAGNDFLRL